MTVPKRTKQHIIDTKSRAIFTAAIPAEWVCNEFASDYAKDYIIEIFADSKPTGEFFVVQLKGQQSPGISRSDGSFAVRIDRDHLAYYSEQLHYPVFIVGVDVNKKEAFYEFAQGRLETDSKMQPLKRTGTASFRVRSEKNVRNTIALLSDIKQAWEFMRDRYPGSVAAAATFRMRQLEKLDPRFRYKVSFNNEKTQVTVFPKEVVKFSLNLHGSPEVLCEKTSAFIDEGAPLVADDNLTIEVVGLPALGTSLSIISTMPHRPVEVSLYAQAPDGTRVSSPEFRGNLDGGKRVLRFCGRLEGCPLNFNLSLTNCNDGRVLVNLQFRFESGVWKGQQLSQISWLDTVFAFATALSQPDAKFGTVVSTKGNVIVDVAQKPPVSAATLTRWMLYMDMIRKARHVARLLNLGTVMPEKWSSQDLMDLDELHALVTSGRFTYPSPRDVELTIRRPSAEVTQSVGGSGAFRLHADEVKYKFLDTEFDIPDFCTELTNWKHITITAVNADSSQLQLFECIKSIVLTRFLPVGSTN